jgi:hypothetical protein
MNMLYKQVDAQEMKQGESLAGALIVFAIAILIGMSLLPSINLSISNAGLTGGAYTMAQLLILVFVIVLVFAGLRLAGLV